MHKRQSFQEIIDRFERAARANLDKLSHIPDLCRAADVSQRTLSRACRAIRGTTPARHLQAIRLDAARSALLSADAKVESITQVAMQFGFRELGRFALQYRAKFGGKSVGNTAPGTLPGTPTGHPVSDLAPASALPIPHDAFPQGLCHFSHNS